MKSLGRRFHSFWITTKALSFLSDPPVGQFEVKNSLEDYITQVKVELIYLKKCQNSLNISYESFRSPLFFRLNKIQILNKLTTPMTDPEVENRISQYYKFKNHSRKIERMKRLLEVRTKSKKLSKNQLICCRTMHKYRQKHPEWF